MENESCTLHFRDNCKIGRNDGVDVDVLDAKAAWLGTIDDQPGIDGCQVDQRCGNQAGNCEEEVDAWKKSR